MAGSYYEAVVRVSFAQAFLGTEVDLELAVLERDPKAACGACRIA